MSPIFQRVIVPRTYFRLATRAKWREGEGGGFSLHFVDGTV